MVESVKGCTCDTADAPLLLLDERALWPRSTLYAAEVGAVARVYLDELVGVDEEGYAYGGAGLDGCGLEGVDLGFLTINKKK